jgi:uncharacterized membrane protein YphA (DoxX/SURF4 family)
MTRWLFHPRLLRAISLFMGLLFIAAAVGKLMDPVKFLGSVSDYRFLPQWILPFYSAGIPGVELLAGLGLVFKVKERACAMIISALLVSFIIALSQAVLRGMDFDCSCFDLIGSWAVTFGQAPWLKAHAAWLAEALTGLGVKLASRVSWGTVLRDVYYLAPMLLVVFAPRARAEQA